MALEFFIANRLRNKHGSDRKKTPVAIRIAVAGITLGLSVMILSVAIVLGFKHQIRDKVIGFGAHIQISSFHDNNSLESIPVGVTDSLLTVLRNHPEVSQIDYYATKPGMIRTDSAFLGIVLKGVPSGYQWDFLQQALQEGCLPQLTDSVPSNEVLLSRDIADKLMIGVGDPLYTYFVQEDRVRVRKFVVSGIYQTHFSDYDKLYLIGDVRQIQRLNAWEADQYSGIEIRLKEGASVDKVSEELYYTCIDLSDPYGETYYVQSLRELNAQLFSWLDLLDMNVWVILALMAVVSGFTMISGLLIIILERTPMIGLLKALGAGDASIRKTFLYLALFLVGKGMLWGNLLGVSLALLQQYTGILKLDAATYYLPAVPIELNLGYWILVNLGCFVVSFLMLLAPSYIIAKMSPAHSMRFE